MGKTCFVPNCHSGYKSNPIKVSVFGAPRDSSMLERWKKAIPRADRLLSCKDAVCAKHFEEKCIISDWFSQTKDGNVLLQVKRGKPKLTKDAIPTLFPGFLGHLTFKPREEKQSLKKRAKKRPPPYEDQNQRPKKLSKVGDDDDDDANNPKKSRLGDPGEETPTSKEEFVMTMSPNRSLPLDSLLYFHNNIERVKLLDFSWVKNLT